MDPIEAIRCPVCGNFFYDNGHGVCDDCYEADRQIPYSEILKKRQKKDGKEETEQKTAEAETPAEDDSVPETAAEENVAEETAPEENPGEAETEENTDTASEDDTDEDDSDMKIFDSSAFRGYGAKDEEETSDKKKEKKKKGPKKILAGFLTFILILLILGVIALVIYAKMYKPLVEGYANGLKYEEEGEYRLAFDEFSAISDYKDANMHITSVAQAMVDANDFDNLYACSQIDPTLPSKLKIKEKNLEEFYDYLDAKLLLIMTGDREQMIEDIAVFDNVRNIIPEQYDKYGEYSGIITYVTESNAHYPDNDALFHMNIAEHLSDDIQNSRKFDFYKKILQQSPYMEFFLSGETPEQRLPADGEEKYNCYWADTDRTYNQNKMTVYKEKQSDAKLKYELDGKFFRNNIEGYENDSFTVQDGNFYSDGKKEEFSVEIRSYYTIELKSIETGETIELTRKV